ncbi:TPA: hypothetical protein NGS02_004447 [Vibrio parahaemolyticus]|nr:hypothetical protein [Vibrio parahaemolyticus]HCE4594825.1 hypothetical protein [Vibrio parahaemolyticus]HCG5929920.1 hypothetical protein [Vibrio parahaemolyticus]
MKDLTLDDWKSIFNIGFFLAMSTVAILSYLQARKTLFSPIKTEIFKLQIEEIKKVLEVFNHKHQSDFDQEMGIQDVVDMNARDMHISFVNCFYNGQLEPPQELLEKLRSERYGAIISEKYANEFFVEVTPGKEMRDLSKEVDEVPLEPALKLAQWGKYEHGMVVYTKKYNDSSEELAKLASSPLLPKELTDMIYKIIDINNKNLSLLGDVMTQAAKEMPLKYNTVDQAMHFKPTWIWNQYNSERQSIDEGVSDILKYINSHLKINEIMN